MQLHLPYVQQNFALNGQKEEMIESQMEKMFCIWIIREKDAKGIFKHNRTEVSQLLITKKADIQILNILEEAVWNAFSF